MPVLDNSYFGEKPEGGGITYGEVRKIIDEQRKLEILKARLDPYLIRQINELTTLDLNNKRKVYSPFPLMVLTLLSIETIGRVIGDIEKIETEIDYEQSKEIVTPVYILMDRNLSYKPTKEFYEAFEKLHGHSNKKSVKRYSDIIHIYQRNTFNHGYQSRGVYLTEDFNNAIEIDGGKGCLYINPYSFWELFKSTYDGLFIKILKNENKDWRKNALRYFDRLIN
jgi:hypothetical protein